MKRVVQLNKLVRLLAVVGIAIIAMATFGLSAPAIAQTTQPTPNLCRATNIDTPVFQDDSTTSRALRIIPKDTRVALRYIPPQGSLFAELQTPVAGFIQTGVLKLCTVPGNPWDRPTTGTACRRVIRPQTGVNIRREPTLNSPTVTTLRPGDKLIVNLTTGNVVKSYRAENYDWVEVNLGQTFPGLYSGTGWMFNTDLINSPNLSNLALCS